MFTLSPHLWIPQARGIMGTIDALNRDKVVCLYSPTGGGKTSQAIELFLWAKSNFVGGAFYVNRKLLVGQTADRFRKAGLRFGIRAADYEDQYDFSAPFQVCSADTERSRVYGPKKYWDLHDVGPGGVVVIDEAHIQKSDTIRQIIDDYKARGAKIVLLTATPIGLSTWADELVVSGKMQEYWACNALVRASVFSPDQPDLAKIKRNATGEYILGEKKRQIYTQSIVGNVIANWRTHNPDARPTLLYAPGVAESVWFCEQFRNKGVNFCHVDATDAVVDGKRIKLTRPVWEEIAKRYKNGEIKGICSRMKLREGIDFPFTFHAILATPIGSLASYIQTCGRVLRYSPETPDRVVITDHGGNYHRHGSPNDNRDWHGIWDLPESVVSELHTKSIKDGETPEPIRCPKCGGERKSGNKCPHCGFTHEKSKRLVVMEDGRMVEREGRLVRSRKVRLERDTAKKWEKLYWGFKKKKIEKSFDQMYAYFQHQYHYAPPRDLPLMPIKSNDWSRKVYKAEMNTLHGAKQPA